MVKSSMLTTEYAAAKAGLTKAEASNTKATIAAAKVQTSYDRQL
jgi:hypothetical protein